jgi:hypothetical protein
MVKENLVSLSSVLESSHTFSHFFQERSDGVESCRLPKAEVVERDRTGEKEYDVLHEAGSFSGEF